MAGWEGKHGWRGLAEIADRASTLFLAFAHREAQAASGMRDETGRTCARPIAEMHVRQRPAGPAFSASSDSMYLLRTYSWVQLVVRSRPSRIIGKLGMKMRQHVPAFPPGPVLPIGCFPGAQSYDSAPTTSTSLAPAFFSFRRVVLPRRGTRASPWHAQLTRPEAVPVHAGRTIHGTPFQNTAREEEKNKAKG